MNFNSQEFARLLAIAKGSQRSINRYGRESEVDPGYISRFLRGKTKYPPSPQVIFRLAEHASNGISAQDLMHAAGHWSQDFIATKKESSICNSQIWEFEDLLKQFTVTYKGIEISDHEIVDLLYWLDFIRFKTKKSL